MIGKLFGLLAHVELRNVLLGSVLFVLMWGLIICMVWLTVVIVKDIKRMVNQDDI